MLTEVVTFIDGYPLYFTPGRYEETIAEQVQGGEYYPDIIPYSEIKTALDVGAHIGIYTRWLMRVAPLAAVVAIEADPENYHRLVWNIGKCLPKDLSRRVLTLSGQAGYLAAEYIWRDSANSGASTLTAGAPARRAAQGAAAVTAIRPPLYTLGQLATLAAAGDDTIDLLKIDAEGAEFDLLENAPLETVARFKWVVGEYHAFAGDFSALARRLAPVFAVVRCEDSAEHGHFLLRNKRYAAAGA